MRLLSSTAICPGWHCFPYYSAYLLLIFVLVTAQQQQQQQQQHPKTRHASNMQCCLQLRWWYHWPAKGCWFMLPRPCIWCILYFCMSLYVVVTSVYRDIDLHTPLRWAPVWLRCSLPWPSIAYCLVLWDPCKTYCCCCILQSELNLLSFAQGCPWAPCSRNLGFGETSRSHSRRLCSYVMAALTFSR